MMTPRRTRRTPSDNATWWCRAISSRPSTGPRRLATDYSQRYVAVLRSMRAKGMFLDPPLLQLLEQSERDG